MCTMYMSQRLTNNTDITLNVVFSRLIWGRGPKELRACSLSVLAFNAACTELLWSICLRAIVNEKLLNLEDDI